MEGSPLSPLRTPADEFLRYRVMKLLQSIGGCALRQFATSTISRSVERNFRITRLNHIAIATSTVEKQQKFWSDVMGLQVRVRQISFRNRADRHTGLQMVSQIASLKGSQVAISSSNCMNVPRLRSVGQCQDTATRAWGEYGVRFVGQHEAGAA